jgi:hypothetical protein
MAYSADLFALLINDVLLTALALPMPVSKLRPLLASILSMSAYFLPSAFQEHTSSGWHFSPAPTPLNARLQAPARH